MIKEIKQNKWLIILIGFIGINIGYMIYRHEINKDIIQLEGSYLTPSQEAYEDHKQSPNESLVDKSTHQDSTYQETFSKKDSINYENETNIEASPQVQVIEEVPIYICGAVKKPGVYFVPTNAIINDVVEKGGGFTEEADPVAINLASQIIPNEKIIVPKVGEEIDKSTDSYDNRERIESSSVSPQPYTSPVGAINLNTATKEQLMTLSGIGEVKAAAIIAYRQEKGVFSSIDELRNISGIGEKTFEKIKQFITT